MSNKTPDLKIKNTAKNKIRRIEYTLKAHPKTANNPLLMQRLSFWKGKA